MQRLCQSLAAEPAVFDGQAIPLNAAFGLTMLDSSRTEEELLALADQDMYAAKQLR